MPGFVEIDLVGHEGGNNSSEFCFTLDITDIATGWTETRWVKNKAQKWVFKAIKEATAAFPFPIRGVDSVVLDIPAWPTASNTRSPSPARGPATRTTAHVEQKN